MKYFILPLFAIICYSSFAQTEELEPRTIDYYFDELDHLEFQSCLDHNILLDSTTVAPEYIDSITGKFNMDGLQIFAAVRMNIYQSYFNGYLFQQKIDYSDHTYVLYFSMAGYDDMEWNIFRWNKASWNNEEKLTHGSLKNDSTIVKILWNYDEATKNTENIRIFIENDYLVMERGNLYHSLYDLRTEEVILNEHSPWHAADLSEGEGLNDWIRENLHDKIDVYLKAERN